jgi:hypothetical protein
MYRGEIWYMPLEIKKKTITVLRLYVPVADFLFCENGFNRGMSHQMGSMRCRSTYQARHTNNSMFIEDLVWTRHYNVKLEYRDIMLITH